MIYILYTYSKSVPIINGSKPVIKNIKYLCPVMPKSFFQNLFMLLQKQTSTQQKIPEFQDLKNKSVFKRR